MKSAELFQACFFLLVWCPLLATKSSKLHWNIINAMFFPLGYPLVIQTCTDSPLLAVMPQHDFWETTNNKKCCNSINILLTFPNKIFIYVIHSWLQLTNILINLMYWIYTKIYHSASTSCLQQKLLECVMIYNWFSTTWFDYHNHGCITKIANWKPTQAHICVPQWVWITCEPLFECKAWIGDAK